MVPRIIFLLAALVPLVVIDSFTAPVPHTTMLTSSSRRMSDYYAKKTSSTTTTTSTPTSLFLEQERRGADVSRSGNKRERLNKLAELQEETVETDKGFVIKAAGAFVGLIVILVGVAAASGVFDQLIIDNAVGY
jgi:hypothetical protein